MKRIVSLAICLLILFATSISAFAEGSEATRQEVPKQLIMKETFTCVSGSRNVETVKKDFISAKMTCWKSYFYLDFRRETFHVYANEGSGAVIERIDLEVDSVGSYTNDLFVKTPDLTALNVHYSLLSPTSKSTTKNYKYFVTDINRDNVLIGGDNHCFACYRADVYYRIDTDKLTNQQLNEALERLKNEDDVTRYLALEEEIASRNASDSSLASVLSEGNIALICIGEAVVFAIIIVALVVKRSKKNNNFVLKNTYEKE